MVFGVLTGAIGVLCSLPKAIHSLADTANQGLLMVGAAIALNLLFHLPLVWGVVPELVPHCADYDEMMERTKGVVTQRELASPGDRIIVTAGVPFDMPGTTNLLKVETV